jgi:hypothetical protein
MSAVDCHAEASEDLLAAYTAHCAALTLSTAAQHDRLRDPKRFVELHGDVTRRMNRPLTVRLVDLKRISLA